MHTRHVEVRKDLEAVSYLLPPCGVQALNSDCQAWQRAFLLPMTLFYSLQFLSILFLSVICHLYPCSFLQPMGSQEFLDAWLRQTAVERQREVCFLEGRVGRSVAHSPFPVPCPTTLTSTESTNRSCTRYTGSRNYQKVSEGSQGFMGPHFLQTRCCFPSLNTCLPSL